MKLSVIQQEMKYKGYRHLQGADSGRVNLVLKALEAWNLAQVLTFLTGLGFGLYLLWQMYLAHGLVLNLAMWLNLVACIACLLFGFFIHALKSAWWALLEGRDYRVGFLESEA